MEWEPDPSSPYSDGYYTANTRNGNFPPDYSSSRTSFHNSQTGLRRRNLPVPPSHNENHNMTKTDKRDTSFKRNLQKLDIFPKVEKDLLHSDSSSSRFSSRVAFGLTLIIGFAEFYNHACKNAAYHHHVTVDKSLGSKMRVDLNITFPALHCNDVHIDIMDVAGDAHNDVVENMKKVRLHIQDGTRLTDEEISVSVNLAHKLEQEALDALDKSLDPNYCGPCYGAQEHEHQCCNHCEDVVNAYKAKKWDYSAAHQLAEQCIREGKTKPKPLTRGEGCNISGFMEFNRVNGNFHIAMGEGVERHGSHIHTFLPEETQYFNTSHVIHTLRFGPIYDKKISLLWDAKTMERTTLEGISKIVTEDNGVTGMIQYFIKIVPTIYKGKSIVKEIDPSFRFQEGILPLLETNRYFATERFTPLVEVEDEHYELAKGFGVEEEDEVAAAKIGGNTGTSHGHHENHRNQKPILPGVFFIYQVHPFAVEISKEEQPFIHLVIRIMAALGGVFTIVGWLDALLHIRKKRNALQMTK